MILTKCFDAAVIIIDDIFEEEHVGVEQIITIENDTEIVDSISAFHIGTYKEVDLD